MPRGNKCAKCQNPHKGYWCPKCGYNETLEEAARQQSNRADIYKQQAVEFRKERDAFRAQLAVYDAFIVKMYQQHGYKPLSARRVIAQLKRRGAESVTEI